MIPPVNKLENVQAVECECCDHIRLITPCSLDCRGISYATALSNDTMLFLHTVVHTVLWNGLHSCWQAVLFILIILKPVIWLYTSRFDKWSNLQFRWPNSAAYSYLPISRLCLHLHNMNVNVSCGRSYIQFCTKRVHYKPAINNNSSLTVN